jgi:hypothetical protein
MLLTHVALKPIPMLEAQMPMYIDPSPLMCETQEPAERELKPASTNESHHMRIFI